MIVVGCSAIVVVTVSVLVYLLLNSNANDRVNQTRASNTEASISQKLERSDVANLNRLTVAEALDELVRIDSSFRRTASLYSYLADISKSDLLDLLRHTETIERTRVRSSIQKIVVRKIVSVDPIRVLDWVTEVPKTRRKPLLKGLFHDWSITNLLQAVEGAQSLNRSDRRTALESMLSTREDLSTSILLDVARRLELEEFAWHQISEIQTLRLLEKPSAAWDALVNDQVEDTKQIDLFQLVASAWKENAGFEVLLRAASAFPNKKDRTALSKVIETLVGSELSEAFHYVRKVSKDERGELPSALAMVAARVEPELALKEIAAWSDDPVHVHLQRIASATWAQTDPRGMLDKLKLVPQVARARALELAFKHLAYVSPTEAIKNLERANEFLSAKSMLPAIIVKQWSHKDPDAALDWSISYAGSNSDLRQHLVRNVFRNLVVSDLDRAIKISGEIFSTYIRGLEASYDVVKVLAQMGKIEDAMARLPLLDNNAGHFATSDLGRMLVRAGEPYAAIELGANIPTPDRSLIILGPATYFNSIFELWARRDPQQLFDSLQSLTSPLLRSMAAQTILNQQKSRPILSKESITDVEALLSEYPITENLHLLELQLQDEKGLIDLDQLVLPADMME